MSAMTYPLYDIGLVVTAELARLILQQHLNLDPPFEYDYSEAHDALDELDVEAYYCPEFEGTATPLKTPDDTEDHVIEFDDDDIVYIPCDRKPSLFSAVYASFEELVDEFRQKLTDAGLNVDGFPLENCICEIAGTYFC